MTAVTFTMVARLPWSINHHAAASAELVTSIPCWRQSVSHRPRVNRMSDAGSHYISLCCWNNKKPDRAPFMVSFIVTAKHDTNSHNHNTRIQSVVNDNYWYQCDWTLTTWISIFRKQETSRCATFECEIISGCSSVSELDIYSSERSVQSSQTGHLLRCDNFLNIKWKVENTRKNQLYFMTDVMGIMCFAIRFTNITERWDINVFLQISYFQMIKNIHNSHIGKVIWDVFLAYYSIMEVKDNPFSSWSQISLNYSLWVGTVIFKCFVRPET